MNGKFMDKTETNTHCTAYQKMQKAYLTDHKSGKHKLWLVKQATSSYCLLFGWWAQTTGERRVVLRQPG